MRNRKYTPRRRTRTIRRRVVRKIVRRVGMSRQMTVSGTHHFKRMLSGNFTSWATGTATGLCSAIIGNAVNAPWRGTFQLNGIGQVINATEFTALYDQYRVNKLVLKFYLKIDPSAQTATTSNIPRLYWYRDYDDGAVPLDLNEIRENSKSKVKVLSLYKPVTIVITPNTLQVLYQSAVSSNYKPVFKQWLDIGTSSTPHYAIKCAIDDLTNTNYRVDVEGIVYFSCRQSR